MRITNFTKIIALLLVIGLGSCQQEEALERTNEISLDTLDKIHQMGFGTRDVQRVENGYLVEGDIVLTDNQLNASHDSKFLRVGATEQYRTTNLVNAGSGRVITVSISSQLSSAYVAALEEALERYNSQNLLIKFQRVSSGADIKIMKSSNGAQYLASAGFPTNGNPYNQVLVNSRAIGSQPQGTVASILAHEIGHCIGFRHTDYMDRSFSCGGAYTNEGASNVGAINIPGTPTAADPNSWMLACIGAGMNRPFNSNDVTALKYLY